MAATLNQISKKLDKIERSLKILIEEESEQLKEERKIKLGEAQVMKLLNKEVSLLFDNITDWKRYVWDTCPYKKTNEARKTIDFVCGKTKNKCRYVDCFRNRQ